MSGSLVLVATPIGNLGDMTFRGIEVLKAADVIACEDTRHTRKLLNHFDIRDVPVLSLHEHNEETRAVEVVRRVSEGQTVAFVTDAGTPGISDPGERVVAQVAAAGLTVSVIPGPSAAPSAIAVSGLPSERWCFEGFLPRKGAERRERLKGVSMETCTSVIYESPHRIDESVRDLIECCGADRPVVMVRELTKLHEEIWRGSLAGLAGRLKERPAPGEIVLVLGGAEEVEDDVTDDDILIALDQQLTAGLTKKAAIAAVAASLSIPKNRVYGVATR